MFGSCWVLIYTILAKKIKTCCNFKYEHQLTPKHLRCAYKRFSFHCMHRTKLTSKMTTVRLIQHMYTVWMLCEHVFIHAHLCTCTHVLPPFICDNATMFSAKGNTFLPHGGPPLPLQTRASLSAHGLTAKCGVPPLCSSSICSCHGDTELQHRL